MAEKVIIKRKIKKADIPNPLKKKVKRKVKKAPKVIKKVKQEIIIPKKVDIDTKTTEKVDIDTKTTEKVDIDTKATEKVDITNIIQQIPDKSISVEQLNKAVELSIDPKMQFANQIEQSHGITRDKAKEKQDHVVNLHIMGLTNATILSQINKAGKTKGWGTYKNINSIQKVINQHFKDYHNPNEEESKEYIKGLKESSFAQQETISETASIYIKQRDKKDDWKPFEKISALKELYLMKQQMVDNRNFNESKFNPNSEQTINNTQINVYMDNSKRIAFGQIENPMLKELRNKLILKYNESKEEI